MGGFRSGDEFVRVFDRLWTMIDEHPEVGPKLREARAPHRFSFTDLDLELNVTYSEEPGHNLRWVWGREGCDWEPLISLAMTSEVANRYFQGKENVATAVLFGRIRLSGPMATILKLAPVLRPIEPLYREMLVREGLDHLLA
ncbi:MAG: hypothetical protein D6738_05835 [Acidobacteria bacterium]|nr:MAG: hypothetical protein D6738_05835 [Acidobacteriota bacterium]